MNSRQFAALALLCAALGAEAADFTFSAFGDTPYSRDEEARFPDFIAEMNREPLAFAVHVGDFKAAWMPCSDELFRQRREWFDLFHHPFLFIPGDSPRKLEKGLGSGADALLLDLEDSIAPERKAEARDTTTAFLKEARTAKDRPR